MPKKLCDTKRELHADGKLKICIRHFESGFSDNMINAPRLIG